MLGTWKIGVLFEPAGGEAPGGDRFALSAAPTGALAFYLADATGHGRSGARFWETFDSSFLESWDRFASEPDKRTLVRFAQEVNDALHTDLLGGSRALGASQLCMAAGCISPQGSLVFANFGLGVHVGPVTADGPCRFPAEESFGLRLGWIPSSEWPQYERSLVIQRVPGLRRLWFASDAFFGDDHRDPEGALGRAEELGDALTGRTIEDALSHVNGLPHAHDDATFVILEPSGAGS